MIAGGRNLLREAKVIRNKQTCVRDCCGLGMGWKRISRHETEWVVKTEPAVTVGVRGAVRRRQRGTRRKGNAVN